MDRSTLQAWLDRYVAAWKSYDADEIAALFADDDEVLRGRDAIVKDWIEPDGNASGRDAPGTYDAHYEPYAVEGDRAVAVGRSLYYSDASQATETAVFHN